MSAFLLTFKQTNYTTETVLTALKTQPSWTPVCMISPGRKASCSRRHGKPGNTPLNHRRTPPWLPRRCYPKSCTCKTRKVVRTALHHRAMTIRDRHLANRSSPRLVLRQQSLSTAHLVSVLQLSRPLDSEEQTCVINIQN